MSRKNSYSVARPSLLGLATPDNVLPHPRLVPNPCLPHFQLDPKSPTLSPPTAPKIIFSPGVSTSTESCVQDARQARVCEQENAHDQVPANIDDFLDLMALLISDCAVHIFCSVEKCKIDQFEKKQKIQAVACLIRLPSHTTHAPVLMLESKTKPAKNYFKTRFSQVSLGRTSEGRSETRSSCDTGRTNGSTL